MPDSWTSQRGKSEVNGTTHKHLTYNRCQSHEWSVTTWSTLALVEIIRPLRSPIQEPSKRTMLNFRDRSLRMISSVLKRHNLVSSLYHLMYSANWRIAEWTRRGGIDGCAVWTFVYIILSRWMCRVYVCVHYLVSMDVPCERLCTLSSLDGCAMWTFVDIILSRWMCRVDVCVHYLVSMDVPCGRLCTLSCLDGCAMWTFVDIILSRWMCRVDVCVHYLVSMDVPCGRLCTLSSLDGCAMWTFVYII